jgi:hypothetical protein
MFIKSKIIETKISRITFYPELYKYLTYIAYQYELLLAK